MRINNDCFNRSDNKVSSQFSLRVIWPDKSTESYDMLDFKSHIKNLQGKYLVIKHHMLQIQGILLQYLEFN